MLWGIMTATYVLASHAGLAIGIDVAGDFVEESRRRHPSCRFEWLDCFEEPDRLKDLVQELCTQMLSHGSPVAVL